jgi:hypothetical protein
MTVIELFSHVRDSVGEGLPAAGVLSGTELVGRGVVRIAGRAYAGAAMSGGLSTSPAMPNGSVNGSSGTSKPGAEGAPLPSGKDIGTLRKLWRFRDYGRAELRPLLLGVLMPALELLADLAGPWPLARVINELLKGGNSSGPLHRVSTAIINAATPYDRTPAAHGGRRLAQQRDPVPTRCARLGLIALCAMGTRYRMSGPGPWSGSSPRPGEIHPRGCADLMPSTAPAPSMRSSLRRE